jgi:hypothetical protein
MRNKAILGDAWKVQNAASGIFPDATYKIPSGRIPDDASGFLQNRKQSHFDIA